MTGLALRLRRLEQMQTVVAHPQACLECGWLPDGPRIFESTFEEPDHPDFCSLCGRQRVFRLEFDTRG